MPYKLNKLEAATRTVLAFNEACNRRDLNGMMALWAEDGVFENTAPAPDGTVYTGKAAVRQFWEDFFRAAPQAHFKAEELFGLGERCVVRWLYTWTNPTGQSGHIRGVDVFRVRDNLILEKFSYVKG
jgi:ketosteroid isomerase-like protein